MTAPIFYGKYLLIDKIGTGGMAELFMAKQTGLKGFEKVMAIKRILPHLTEDAEFISMFINEAKLAALLSHQNIVQIFDLGHVENSYFIAMEYIMGKDLRTILHRAKALNLPVSVGHGLLMTAQVCAGLDYAHRKKDLTGRDLGIVHRDISPQNILVSYEGEVKVVDFGIAKAASQTSETRTGILKGKLSYMSPEQARGLPVDRRSDIFAIGILLYEILTGHKLFKGDNDLNTLEKVREAKVEPPPTSLNKEVTPELETILCKALAKDPADRYQSASDLQMALEEHMAARNYDFSASRLSLYLRKVFQYDIEQDTQRFRTASGATADAGAGSGRDASTFIRGPRPLPDQTPTHPGPRRRAARLAVTTANPRTASPLRVMILTILGTLGAAVLLSMLNPPFLERWTARRPEARMAVHRLSGWPDRAVRWITRDSPPSVSRVPLREIGSEEGTPTRSEIGDPIPSLIEPGSMKGIPELEVPDLDREVSERPEPTERVLTAAEKNEVRRLLEDAKTAYGQRRLDEVERILRRIIELNPDIPVTYHLMGTLSLERKDPQAALRVFEEASRKFPDYALLHYDLGFLYFNQGITSLATDEFKKGLAIDPNAPQARRARVIVEGMERPPTAGSNPREESMEARP